MSLPVPSQVPTAWLLAGRPSNKWYKGFEKRWRHRIRLRKSDPLEHSRLTLYKEQVDSFYTVLQRVSLVREGIEKGWRRSHGRRGGVHWRLGLSSPHTTGRARYCCCSRCETGGGRAGGGGHQHYRGHVLEPGRDVLHAGRERNQGVCAARQVSTSAWLSIRYVRV